MVNGYPAISYLEYTKYSLKYTYYTPAPEITVLGSGTEIADGNTTPSSADPTNFGSVGLGQTLTRTFTISTRCSRPE